MVSEQQRQDVTSYLHAQAARMTTDQLLAKCAAEVEALLTATAGLDEDEFRWSPDGEWSAQTILQHLVDSAKRGVYSRFRY